MQPLRTVVLHLARNPGFPDGSRARGYELRVPLAPDGTLDADTWRARREDCVVRRFWGGEPDQHGWLIHRGRGWAFSYAPGTEDDEALFRLGDHRFALGEYVTVREPDGDAWTYRVDAVR